MRHVTLHGRFFKKLLCLLMLLFLLPIESLVNNRLEKCEVEVSCKKLSVALQQAETEIDKLFLTQDELKHLAEYFEFFASWYAAVTPAPLELYNSLSQQALNFVSKIKKIAKPLERTQDRRLMGSSKLTDAGKLFYKKAIDLLKNKINYAPR